MGKLVIDIDDTNRLGADLKPGGNENNESDGATSLGVFGGGVSLRESHSMSSGERR